MARRGVFGQVFISAGAKRVNTEVYQCPSGNEAVVTVSIAPSVGLESRVSIKLYSANEAISTSTFTDGHILTWFMLTSEGEHNSIFGIVLNEGDKIIAQDSSFGATVTVWGIQEFK